MMGGFLIRRSQEMKSNAIVKSDDTVIKQQKNTIEGSVALCAAILKTKKLYRKMSKREVDAAIEYAHNVNVVSVED